MPDTKLRTQAKNIVRHPWGVLLLPCECPLRWMKLRPDRPIGRDICA